MQQETRRLEALARWRRAYLVFAVVVLLVPAFAMQFTREVAWGPGDFVAATGLLAAMWLAVEFVAQHVSGKAGRVIAISLIAAAAIITWAHLAVGVF